MYPGLKTEWITAHNYKRIWRILITAFYKVRKNISLWREDGTKSKDLNSSFCVLFSFSLRLAKTGGYSIPVPWHHGKTLAKQSFLVTVGRLVISGHRKLFISLPHDFPLGISMHLSLLNSYTEMLKFNSVNKLGWALEGMTQGHRWDRKKRR